MEGTGMMLGTSMMPTKEPSAAKAPHSKPQQQKLGGQKPLRSMHTAYEIISSSWAQVNERRGERQEKLTQLHLNHWKQWASSQSGPSHHHRCWCTQRKNYWERSRISITGTPSLRRY